MNHRTNPAILDAEQQDSAQVAALAGSQVHPDSALPSRTTAEWDNMPGAKVPSLAAQGVDTNSQPQDGLLDAAAALVEVLDEYHEQLVPINRKSATVSRLRDVIADYRAHPGTSWTPASRPPDADTTVMLALADGEVWQGYFDGTDWIEVSGLRLAPGRVTEWMHTPAHPRDRA